MKVSSFMIREDPSSPQIKMSDDLWPNNYVVRLGGDAKYSLHFDGEVPYKIDLEGQGVEA